MRLLCGPQQHACPPVSTLGALCNRPVGHFTLAELKASFCDNLLKKAALSLLLCALVMHLHHQSRGCFAATAAGLLSYEAHLLAVCNKPVASPHHHSGAPGLRVQACDTLSPSCQQHKGLAAHFLSKSLAFRELLRAAPMLIRKCMLQGGTEKLSDEEIESTLEKVVRLLA